MSHAAATWKSLQALRAQAPLIHCITNLVSMDVVANVLLAVGASPAMVQAEEEVEEFLEIADTLVINIGTLTSPQLAAMRRAAARAAELNRPWVLDPVAAGATSFRTHAAIELARARPSVIRGNASEILALAGAAQGRTRGVDTSHAPEDAIAAARTLARTLGSVVAVTGAVDHLTDGERLLKVRNGDSRMTRVTALGCALSAVAAAFLAVEDDPLRAAAQALAVFGLAGERAAAFALGPGSLRVTIVDELALLEEAAVREGVRIEG